MLFPLFEGLYNNPLVGKMKNRDAGAFAAWSQGEDPDGLTWELQETGKYYPIYKNSLPSPPFSTMRFCKELQKELVDILAVKDNYQLDWEVVKRKQGERFQVVLWCWVVERTLEWLVRHRRLVIDYETLLATSEAFIRAAIVRIMVRRTA